MASLLAMARSGGLDGALISTGRFYQTNYTKPLLFLADGSYLEASPPSRTCSASQWGMMNETGQLPRPGVALALHLLVPGPAVLDLRQRRRADLGDHGASSRSRFVCIPFIPGVRSIPRYVPLYRLIWRDYYRVAEGERGSAGTPP